MDRDPLLSYTEIIPDKKTFHVQVSFYDIPGLD